MPLWCCVPMFSYFFGQIPYWQPDLSELDAMRRTSIHNQYMVPHTSLHSFSLGGLNVNGLCSWEVACKHPVSAGV